MPRLQRFVDTGIKEFEMFINGQDKDQSPDFINLQNLVLPVAFNEIEKIKFDTKLDFVKYISGVLDDVPDADVYNPGLWAWLSAFYIDQVAPTMYTRSLC